MHVAIVIVGYRNALDILQCLSAIESQTHADFEVVICENGGEEAFRALTAALPATLAGGQKVRAILAASNLGYAGGVNLGMASTPAADAWLVLNPDTQPAPTALAALVERLGLGDCEAVGCPVDLPNGTVQSYGGLWRIPLARAVSIGHGKDSSGPIDLGVVEAAQSYLNGACMLVGRGFVAAIGPMREDYFLYCEEVEWCLRARKAGLRLGFTPVARILHHAGTTTGSYNAIRNRPRLPVYLNERNRLLLTRDLFPAYLIVAAPAALALLLLRYGRSGAWVQLRYALAGWFAGIRNARGVPRWA
jgi:N-acetylglucosaminyl-diphospho-decaprenol L-rhamnosyltransferase